MVTNMMGEDLQTQYKYEKRVKPHKCDKCGKKFRFKGNLSRHQVLHLRQNIHKCDKCGKVLTTKRTLREHQLIHSGEKPHKCDTCGKNFRLKGNLAVHRRLHARDRTYKCRRCGEIFTCQDEFSQHRVAHKQERPHKCNYCAKTFRVKSQLKRHLAVHTRERAHKCDVCGKRFSERGGMKKHLIRHSKVMPFNCEACGKGFVCQSGLTQHQLHVHAKERPLKCDHCGKGFTRSSRLKLHMLKHGIFKCGLCGQAFEDGGCRCKQPRVYGGTPFKCDMCGRLFTCENHLTQHRLEHTELKHVRDTCGITFTGRNSFKRHQLVHTGERPYKCEQCLKGFRDARSLGIHTYLHTGYRPFRCEECGKAFRHKHHFIDHLQIHTRETPHQCEKCGKKFIWRIDLKQHRIQHEELQTVEEDDQSLAKHGDSVKCQTVDAHLQREPHSSDKGGKVISPKTHPPQHVLINAGQEPRKCEKCGEGFTQLGSLLNNQTEHPRAQRVSQHQCPDKDTHNSEKIVNNQDCLDHGLEASTPVRNSSFPERQNQRTCTREQPYNGEECRKREGAEDSNCYLGRSLDQQTDIQSNSSLSSLATREPISLGEKAHRCNPCRKTFTHKRDLEEHSLLHTVEQPYKCEECGMCFVQKSLLTDHERIHHTDDAKRRQPGTSDQSDLVGTLSPHTLEKTYECEKCGICFRQESLLINHEFISHTVDAPYTCSKCPKRFKWKSDLIRHYVQCKYESFRCNHCGKTFTHKNKWEQHQCLRLAEGRTKCYLCGTFTAKEKLQQHLLSHKVGQPYKCDQCEVYFLHERRLSDHQRIYHSAKYTSVTQYLSPNDPPVRHYWDFTRKTASSVYKCDLCGKLFKCTVEYAQHLFLHELEEPHKCDERGIGFEQESLLNERKRVHTGEAHYKCCECGKSFTMMSGVTNHKLCEHNGPKQLKCRTCDAGFATTSEWTQHPRLTHRCEECRKRVKSYECCPQHRAPEKDRSESTRNQTQTCGKCGETCADRSSQHQCSNTRKTPREVEGEMSNQDCHEVHNSEKQTPVDIELLGGDLAEGQHTQTEEESHRCKRCMRIFIHKRDLDQHLLSHATEEPFKCEKCGMGFAQNSLMTDHQRIHTPHTCKRCHKSFVWKSDLNRHKCPNEDHVFECSQCGKTFKLVKFLKQHQCYMSEILCTDRSLDSTPKSIPPRTSSQV